MKIDPNITLLGECGFDSAQQMSLAATLATVRLHRRIRRCMRTGIVVLAVGTGVWATLPVRVSPNESPPVLTTQIFLKSVPLTQEQRIVSVKALGSVIRTPADARTEDLTIPSGPEVVRLGDTEFHKLLAAYNAYCIQLPGKQPEIGCGYSK